jgi:hypothetical protein
MRQLKTLAKAADELVLMDNTVEGRSARVVAQFVSGKIVKLARSVAGSAQEVFGREVSEWLAPKDRVKERGR